MMAKNSTNSMREAIKWLAEHGGDGCRIGVGRVQVLAQGDVAPFRWITFKKLEAAGAVEQYGKWRLRLVEAKKEAA